MNETIIIALIVNVGAVIVALVNRGGWRRCEVKLDALAKHLGVRLEDTGKVIVLERKGTSAAVEQRE